MRFDAEVEIAGMSLHTSLLRDSIVERLREGFNVDRIAVSDGVPLSGKIDEAATAASLPQPLPAGRLA